MNIDDKNSPDLSEDLKSFLYYIHVYKNGDGVTFHGRKNMWKVETSARKCHTALASEALPYFRHV